MEIPKPQLNKEQFSNSFLNSYEKGVYSTVLKFNGQNANEWKDEFIENFKNFRDNINDFKAKMLTFIEGLDVSNIKDKKDFSIFVSKAIVDHLNKNFTKEEIEMYSRKHHELKGNKEINRILTYHTSESDLYLHVPMTVVDSNKELTSLLKDGLSKLAEMIKLDPKLSSIKNIKGISWMVFSHPKFINELGFEIESIDDDKKEGTASISREKLLEIYGE